jgi:Holliday junction resolvase RusA-like endonuclease
MTGPRSITIGMPYPGDVISVNHYRGQRQGGGYYIKAEAQSWMDMLGWIIKPYHLEEWRLPLRVICTGTFKDLNHCPDISNLSKCILDAIEEVTGVNDRNYLWQDNEPAIDSAKEPELVIKIEEAT